MEVIHHATIIRSACPCDYHVDKSSGVEQVFVALERFGIDDARRLVDQAYQRPRAAAVQQLVVQTDFITHEAQNALLKVLEEPPVSTRFLFVIPPDLTLLPTLASRFAYGSAPLQREKIEEVFTLFKNLSYGERIAAVELALKKKDVAWQRAMKRGLIQYLAHYDGDALQDLEHVARLLLTRGASNKMLFEHMALTLPLS